ncbi:MAG: Rossmann-like domain-containing protein [Methermicoccaceae archaeon]
MDVLDLIREGDSVAMVGYFAPLISEILRKVGRDNFWVLEKRGVVDKKVEVLPSEQAPGVLPSSDVVIMSATTLLNGTVDELLTLTGGAREVVLLGPTASMLPNPMFDSGFTAVMGVQITDSEQMMRVVGEAGGTKQLLSSCAEKMAFVREQTA